jgi:hypothetical protein
MIYGTKLLDTDIEMFAASLSQSEVYVWAMNEQDVYEQIDSGHIVKFSPDTVRIRSSKHLGKAISYRREYCEFSVKPL